MTEPSPQRLASSDNEAWLAYWKAQDMAWRTEPEIDKERQRYLTERRAVKPEIDRGIYPFKDIKLDRADVEWLLATHESGGMAGQWTSRRRGTNLRPHGVKV